MSARDHAQKSEDEDPVEVQDVLDTSDVEVPPATEPSEQPQLPDFNT